MTPWFREPGSAPLTEAREPVEAPRSLLEYWWVIARRRSVVLSCLGASLALSVLYILLGTPEYQASTTLQIDRQGPDILTFKDVVGVDPSYAAYQDFYQTQYKILQSRTVIRMAVERLDLMNVPEFASRTTPALVRLHRWIKPRLFGSPGDPADPLDPALKFVEDNLAIRPIRDSQLVVVAFTDRNPRLARDVAQALAESYLQFNYDSRYGTTTIAREFLTKEVARVQSEIDALEHRLQGISNQKEIYAASDGVQDISEQALGDYNRRYVDARGSLAVAQARFATLRSVSPEALPEVMNSPLITNLKQQHAEVERRYSQMAQRFKHDWPPLLQLRDELDQARHRLETETQTIVDRVLQVAERDFLRAELEVKNLEAQVEKQKVEVQRVNRDAVEFASLRGAIETKRAGLSDLVARQSQTETSERLQDTSASNIRVVDAAELPEKPVRPKKLMNLLLGLLLGSGVGIALAFLLDHLDNTIKTEEDIQNVSGLPVLGYIPLHREVEDAPEKKDGTPFNAGADLVSHQKPQSPFAEAFKNMRTSILLASPDQAPRHIVISSCEPNDGKSTVALNLAVVLTQLGRRVLLVDADLRRPRLHKVLGVSADIGLSNLLSGNAISEELVQNTVVVGLDFIASGPVPPNPSELLDSQGLQALLTYAQRTRGYDHVIFDSPPALSVSDPLILAARLDGMILVVRAGETARESLAHATARLRNARVKVVGAVLNAVTESGERYHHYYGRHRPYSEELRATSDSVGTVAAFARRSIARSRGRSEKS